MALVAARRREPAAAPPVVDPPVAQLEGDPLEERPVAPPAARLGESAVAWLEVTPAGLLGEPLVETTRASQAAPVAARP